MADYRIFETAQFVDDLKDIFRGRGGRVGKKLTDFVYPQLRINPYFGKNIKKLRNYKPDTWRYRIGDFRFFYEIDDDGKIIYMTTADDRKDSYRHGSPL